MEFYKLSLEEKVEFLKEFASLDKDETDLLKNWMQESPKPLEFAVKYKINRKDYAVPMASDEPYVVPAADHGAKLTYKNGIETYYSGPYMLGHVQLAKLSNIGKTLLLLEGKKQELIDHINQGHQYVKAEDICFEVYEDYLVPEIKVNTGDAMGAMVVTSMCEDLGKYLEKITDGKAIARILSNYPCERMVKAKTKIKKDVFKEHDVLERILYLQKFAEDSIKRAPTHNKGIMNNVCAVLEATTNDYRAAYETACAYAYRSGRCKPLSKWYLDKSENLIGELEIPIVVGTKGKKSSLINHPKPKLARKILGVEHASELAQIAGAVGLGHIAGLYKISSTEGITPGHERVDERRQRQK